METKSCMQIKNNSRCMVTHGAKVHFKNSDLLYLELTTVFIF